MLLGLMQGPLGFAVFLILLFLACLPGLVAIIKGTPRRSIIFFLGLFFSWTIVGWILMMVWAFLEPYYRIHADGKKRKV